MVGGRKTRRRQRTRKQRGGQGRLPIFQKLSGNRVNLDLPTSLPAAPNERNTPSLNTVSEQFLPRNLNTSSPNLSFSYEATPSLPLAVEQTPPSSLEFQIFFTKFQKLIDAANLSSTDIVKFVVLLADLVTELHLNSDEIIRVLELYELLLTYQYSNSIGNRPRVRRYNVYENLEALVRGLKRTNQLLTVDFSKLF